MMWHYTPKGVFTVASAYRAGMENYRRQEARGESSSGSGDTWNWIWDLFVPPESAAFRIADVPEHVGM